jgi:hypothetical protein
MEGENLTPFSKDPQNKIYPLLFFEFMIVYLMAIKASHFYLAFLAKFSQIVSLLKVFDLYMYVFYVTNFTVARLIHYFLLDLIVLSMFGSIY